MALLVIALILIVITLTIRITRRMQNNMARAAVVICITLISGVVGYVFIALAAFSFDYPEIEERISHDYYFTHQQYGMAFTSTDGQQLVFYRKKRWWRDEQLGHINCVYCSDKVDVKLAPRNEAKVELILSDDGRPLLDTVLNNGFDFFVDREK